MRAALKTAAAVETKQERRRGVLVRERVRGREGWL